MSPNKPQPSVAVLVPVYKPQLSEYEAISLRQCCAMLGKYALTLVKPQSLSIETYREYGIDWLVESFDDRYFKDVNGYNELMLSAAFYQRFLGYDYILIHQLDAFVFKDDLLRWCLAGYDYIGAPWLALPLKGHFLKRLEHWRRRRKVYRRNKKQKGTNLPVDLQFANRVGNGGFSLRRVDRFYSICQQESAMIDYYKENSMKHYSFNEDVFWSLEVNRRSVQLKIPNYGKAVGFSIEWHPEYALTLTKGELPFGCHAWDLFIPFWRNIFKGFNYDI